MVSNAQETDCDNTLLVSPAIDNQDDLGALIVDELDSIGDFEVASSKKLGAGAPRGRLPSPRSKHGRGYLQASSLYTLGQFSWGWWTYFAASSLLLFLLCLDPHFNAPSGLLSLELLTRKSYRHGFDPCAWDYDGSWKVGALSGASPVRLNISERPLITCATVMNTSVSFVATPFVHIPTGAPTGCWAL